MERELSNLLDQVRNLADEARMKGYQELGNRLAEVVAWRMKIE